MFFGHLPEVMFVLVLGLLVFGPKRMIDMGSSFGKAFREFRNATKDLTWTNLMSGGGEDEKPSALSQLSQVSQTFGSANGNGASETAGPVTTSTRVVDADKPGEEPSAN